MKERINLKYKLIVIKFESIKRFGDAKKYLYVCIK